MCVSLCVRVYVSECVCVSERLVLRMRVCVCVCVCQSAFARAASYQVVLMIFTANMLCFHLCSKGSAKFKIKELMKDIDPLRKKSRARVGDAGTCAGSGSGSGVDGARVQALDVPAVAHTDIKDTSLEPPSPNTRYSLSS